MNISKFIAASGVIVTGILLVVGIYTSDNGNDVLPVSVVETQGHSLPENVEPRAGEDVSQGVDLVTPSTPQDEDLFVVEDFISVDTELESFHSMLSAINLNSNLDDDWLKLEKFQNRLAYLIGNGYLHEEQALQFLAAIPLDFGAATAEVLSSLFDPKVLAEMVVDLVPTSTGYSKDNYLKLLSMTGTQNKSQRESIISQLSGISDQSTYGLALSTITPIAVDPEERNHVRSIFTNHMMSENTNAVSAAIAGSSAWSFRIEQPQLEYGLKHHSEEVRLATLTHVYNRVTNNDTVKHILLSTINDESLSDRERFSAHDALGNFDMTSEEYAIYHSFWGVVDARIQAAQVSE